MKTKLITMTVLLAAIILVPSTFAEEARPGQGARRDFAANQPAQGASFLQEFTPEQRARIREFVQQRLQEQQQRFQEQRQQLQARIQDPDLVPQDQPFAQQQLPARRFAQMQRPLRGQGTIDRPLAARRQGPMNEFRGQARMERPSADRDIELCPHCGRPMPQARLQSGRRPFAGQGFSGAEQSERPFRGQGFNRPRREGAERPDAMQGFPGRGMGAGRGMGFGPRQFQEDAETQQAPRPQEQQQDQQPQRQRRARVLTEPESERLGRDLQDAQPRPGFRRNAQ